MSRQTRSDVAVGPAAWNWTPLTQTSEMGWHTRSEVAVGARVS